MNANEVYPWMLMRKCLLAMLILMLVILMLILMLLNLNTGYADTDADLCIKIMSFCCINCLHLWSVWFDLSKVLHHISKTGEVHAGLLWPARSAYAGEAFSVIWSNRPGHQRSSGATGVRRLGKWRSPESQRLYTYFISKGSYLHINRPSMK